MLHRILLITGTFISFSSFCPLIQAAPPSLTEKRIVRERVKMLDKSLAEAKKGGKLPSKVHVYSNKLANRIYYEKVIEKYYHNSTPLVYSIVPEIYIPSYIDKLAMETAGEFVFFGDLPPSYPSFQEPIWAPFFEAYPVWGIHGDYYGRHHHRHAIHPKKHLHSSTAVTHPHLYHSRPSRSASREHRKVTPPVRHLERHAEHRR